jgi:endonuclease/exonuclease/phosphatase (EEP) superfamily protein YafD
LRAPPSITARVSSLAAPRFGARYDVTQCALLCPKLSLLMFTNPVEPSSKRGYRIVGAVAWLYPVILLGTAAILRYVGERWWVASVALYLPRVLLAAPLPVLALVLAASGRLRRFLWAPLAASCFLLAVLMGFVPPWPTSPARDAPTLRVLSYNVNSALGGVSNIVAEIEGQSPDIVVLQEIGAATDEMQALLGEHYQTVRVSGQFLLATRYPVVDAVQPEGIEFEGRIRSPRFVRQHLVTPLGEIALYNVHPISPRETFYTLRGQGLRGEILSGRLFSPAHAPIVQANSDLRARQVKAFADSAGRETDPVVIAGDTNLPGLSFVYGQYLSGYQDGFAKAGWGFGYTFPNNRRPWMRIDRILASERLRFVRFDVGHSAWSDHRCVVADLQAR